MKWRINWAMQRKTKPTLSPTSFVNPRATLIFFTRPTLIFTATPLSVSTEEQLKKLKTNFPARVISDIQDLRQYFLRNKNFIEPLMSGAYDNYLRLNSQPKGRATYNEVIAYLIAYMKKFGVEAI